MSKKINHHLPDNTFLFLFAFVISCLCFTLARKNPVPFKPIFGPPLAFPKSETGKQFFLEDDYAKTKKGYSYRRGFY